MKNNKKGFTLIEILVVVAIIAILSSVVLIGLGPTRRAGRDARRVSDLRQVQNAMELYFNKCGYYPGPAQGGAACIGVGGALNTWAQLTAALIGTPSIGVVSVPNDPNAGVNYTVGTTANSYTLGAALEDPANPVLAQDLDVASNGIPSCVDPIYCVSL